MKGADNQMMSQHKREAATRHQVADNKNSVATRKLGHDIELSKVKNSSVSTQMLRDKKTFSQQESNLLAT